MNTGEKTWAYDWRFGSYLLPRAKTKIQYFVGFIFWCMAYIIAGSIATFSYNPPKYEYLIGVIIVAPIAIVLTSARKIYYIKAKTSNKNKKF